MRYSCLCCRALLRVQDLDPRLHPQERGEAQRTLNFQDGRRRSGAAHRGQSDVPGTKMHTLIFTHKNVYLFLKNSCVYWKHSKEYKEKNCQQFFNLLPPNAFTNSAHCLLYTYFRHFTSEITEITPKNVDFIFLERQHDVRQVAPTEGLPPHRGRLPRAVQEGGGPQLGEAGCGDGQQHREPHGELKFERLKCCVFLCEKNLECLNAFITSWTVPSFIFLCFKDHIFLEC